MPSRWRSRRLGCRCSTCYRRRPSRPQPRRARTFCGSSPRPPDPTRLARSGAFDPPSPKLVKSVTIRSVASRCVRNVPRAKREPVAHTSETIGEEVRERLGQMTPSERRVARTLLATYPSAGLESLPQLAESAGVTGPTVLRFVRKVGFEGYPDFQRSLREEVQARSEGLPSLYVTRAGIRDDDVLGQSHEAFARALEATLASSSLQEDLTK